MSFFLQDTANFSVQRDHVFDHVQNLQRMGLPMGSWIDPSLGNDPAFNPTLRVNVQPKGSLVYCLEPAKLSDPDNHENPDGCFDGRNHVYFSDGTQWIPLGNCLPEQNPPPEVVNCERSSSQKNVIPKWINGGSLKGGQNKCTLGDSSMIEHEKSIITIRDAPTCPGEIRLDDSDSGKLLDGRSPHHVGFKAAIKLDHSTVWQLPVKDGIKHQRLVTNGSKELGWEDSCCDTLCTTVLTGPGRCQVPFGGEVDDPYPWVVLELANVGPDPGDVAGRFFCDIVVPIAPSPPQTSNRGPSGPTTGPASLINIEFSGYCFQRQQRDKKPADKLFLGLVIQEEITKGVFPPLPQNDAATPTVVALDQLTDKTVYQRAYIEVDDEKTTLNAEMICQLIRHTWTLDLKHYEGKLIRVWVVTKSNDEDPANVRNYIWIWGVNPLELDVSQGGTARGDQLTALYGALDSSTNSPLPIDPNQGERHGDTKYHYPELSLVVKKLIATNSTIYDLPLGPIGPWPTPV